MLTTLEKSKLICKEAVYSINGLSVNVIIHDWREKNFGRFEVQISPVSGSGQVWVTIEKVTVNTSK